MMALETALPVYVLETAPQVKVPNPYEDSGHFSYFKASGNYFAVPLRTLKLSSVSALETILPVGGPRNCYLSVRSLEMQKLAAVPATPPPPNPLHANDVHIYTIPPYLARAELCQKSCI